MPKNALATKLFVLDTNVILHDAGCLRSFEDNDIAIPITVLEELDRFKRGTGDINFQAREFLRQLDAIPGDVTAPEGVSLGPGLGTIRVPLEPHLHEQVRQVFLNDSCDHRVLSTALDLRGDRPSNRTVVVSKDTCLRMKAKALGLRAEDYTTDKLDSFDQLYSGWRKVEHVPSAFIDSLYSDEEPACITDWIPDPCPNESFIIRNGTKSALARYRADTGRLVPIGRQRAYGIEPRNAEQSFALSVLLDDDIKLVTISGRAGTGKTLLALAAALERRSAYRQILLARPIVPLSNRDLGYLPGDVDDKIGPYMQPLFDNLAVVRDENGGERDPSGERLRKMRETGKLEISPLAYIRGRSLQRVFFIVDEAQNLTPHEVKTIITRAGEGTKIVLTGDVHQIDQPYVDALSNGLSYLSHRMIGQPIYAHVTLRKGERSALADLASELL